MDTESEKRTIFRHPPSIRALRIGAVPYLNSKVLIWGLEELAPTHGFTLTLHTPSELAKLLQSGALEVGLASSIEYFRNPGYLLLPGLGVCGCGAMCSIQLFHRRPLRQLRRVGLDPASETTNALLGVLVREHWRREIDLVPLSFADDPVARTDLDGFLKIGDACLAFSHPDFQKTDLLGEWQALTGLPFVFAAWLVRPEAQLGELPGLLQAAKEAGLRNAERIADRYHQGLGIPRDLARAYVASHVRYDLGAEELRGLLKFQDYLAAGGLLAGQRKLEFYGGA